MRELKYRVVELKALRQSVGFRVDAWLLVQGRGRAVHFAIADGTELEGALNKAISEVYTQVTGNKLS